MIHTVEFAAKALARLDDALSNVSGERGRLGALHNRLEAAIQHSGIYQENLAAAESRIRDADMALEIMEHIKASILQQSASAMLVHANLAPKVFWTFLADSFGTLLKRLLVSPQFGAKPDVMDSAQRLAWIPCD